MVEMYNHTLLHPTLTFIITYLSSACESAAAVNGTITAIINSCIIDGACKGMGNDHGSVGLVSNSCNSGLEVCMEVASERGTIGNIMNRYVHFLLIFLHQWFRLNHTHSLLNTSSWLKLLWGLWMHVGCNDFWLHC